MAADKSNDTVSICDDNSTDNESDSTDYEPDPKKVKLEDVEKGPKTNGKEALKSNLTFCKPSSSKERTVSPDITEVALENSQSVAETQKVSLMKEASCTSNLNRRAPSQSGNDGCSRSLRIGLRRRRTSQNETPEKKELLGNQDCTEKDEEMISPKAGKSSPNPIDDGHNISTPPSSVSSDGYIIDDIDINEIPSDLEFSPPTPFSLPMHRERVNTIFEHGDPPPMTEQEQEIDQFYHNEFELASVSDQNENPIEDANSTSEGENQALHVVEQRNEIETTGGKLEESDRFADSESESESNETHNTSFTSKGSNSSDSEISENDKWFCTQCDAKSAPYFRYCLKCFQIRRNWLPKRPASKRLKRRNRKKASAAEQNNSLNSSRTTAIESDNDYNEVDGIPQRIIETKIQTVNDHASSGRECIQTSLPHAHVDLNQGFLVDENNPSLSRLNSNTQPGNVTLAESQQSLQSYQRSATGQATTETTSTDVQSQYQSLSLSSSKSQYSLFSQTSSPSQSLDFLSPRSITSEPTSTVTQYCSVCLVRPKDAAFVHNKIAHQYCCYKCADKILKKDGICPICREKVHRVVKVYIV